MIEKKSSRDLLILIQKADSKSKSWAKELSEIDRAKLVPLEGSPLLIPIQLLKLYLKRARVDGLIFRYLNDYPSLAKTLARVSSEIAAYLVVTFLHHGRIAWICHNIDKESEENFPFISRFRRRFFAKKSVRVFVTSDLLVPYAIVHLDISHAKIGVASFGPPPSDVDSEKKVDHIYDLTHHVEKARIQYKHVGLWIGSPAQKSADGLKSFVRFILAMHDRGESHYAVVVGVNEKWIETAIGHALNERLKDKEFFKVVGPLDLPWQEWKIFDYIWKPCDDISLTMTALNAAAAGVLLVAHKGSFLGEFVEHYKIGFTVDPENPEIEQSEVLRLLAEGHDELWERQSWHRGATALKDAFFGLKEN